MEQKSSIELKLYSKIYSSKCLVNTVVVMKKFTPNLETRAYLGHLISRSLPFI